MRNSKNKFTVNWHGIVKAVTSMLVRPTPFKRSESVSAELYDRRLSAGRLTVGSTAAAASHMH